MDEPVKGEPVNEQDHGYEGGSSLPAKRCGLTFLTPDDLATMLSLSPKTICQMAREDGSMPVTRIGRAIRFEQQALHRWLFSKQRRGTTGKKSVTGVEASE
jgi:excisionase family DNA binding protein